MQEAKEEEARRKAEEEAEKAKQKAEKENGNGKGEKKACSKGCCSHSAEVRDVFVREIAVGLDPGAFTDARAHHGGCRPFWCFFLSRYSLSAVSCHGIDSRLREEVRYDARMAWLGGTAGPCPTCAIVVCVCGCHDAHSFLYIFLKKKR